VNKSLYSQSYDWSFDSDYWYNVENTSSPYNYFGEFPSGTDSFRIYVRGRNVDTLTAIYSQVVSFPQGLSSGGENKIEETMKDETVQERDAENEPKHSNTARHILLNMLGQVVLEGEGSSLDANSIRQRLSPGLYILLLEDTFGKKSARKIFISNKR
jgi:hypothetical protein